MTDLIILRLYPTSPMAAADFTAALAGLTITVFDLTVGDPAVGVEIGQASGLANPHLTSTTNNTVNINSTQILQHYIDQPLPSGRQLESAATAVVVVNAPAGHPEYPGAESYDLRLQITRGGLQLIDATLDFNVATVNVTTLPNNQKTYFAMPPSAFRKLPAAQVGLDPSFAYVPIPANGAPPAFDTLVTTIDLVLAQDPSGVTLAQAPTLTAAQCQQIAYEIVWNRTLNPQPAPPTDAVGQAGSLGAMYTDPPVDTSITATDVQTAREQFEGQLTAYYATLDAQATQLSGFIYAAYAAVICETLSRAAPVAGIITPLITPASSPTTLPQAVVTFDTQGAPQTKFVVPAAYFYALTATMPPSVLPPQRFALACALGEQNLLNGFQSALGVGAIATPEAPTTPGPPPENIAQTPDQAARRLVAIGAANGTGAPIAPSAADALFITGWLAYPGPSADIDTAYWTPEVAAQPTAYLEFVLELITGNLPALIADIKGPPLNVADVAELVAVTDQQWRDFFANPAVPLPDFTLPGARSERIEAFIANLETFFTVPLVPPPAVVPVTPAPPTIPLPIGDVFARFAAAYLADAGSAFAFGAPWNGPAVDAAIAQTFPGDPAAQAWLRQALDTIEALWTLTDIGQPERQFSLIEALYARGFVTAAQVAAFSSANFQDALEGSVAYPFAAAIHALAGPGPAVPPAPGPFRPVNTGKLTDCAPPCHLSPLGPVEYLHELLLITAGATCEEPTAAVGPTLGALLVDRRGDLGQLHATEANVDLRVPVIDLVNESLEALAAAVPTPSGGAVYDTLDEPDAAARLTTTPQHASPSTPVAKPAAYEALKADFSSPALPYAQALDIDRAYLSLLGSSRYAAMRHFRRRITEFAIAPDQEPADFRTHLWRYPVRFDIAREYLRISQDEYDLLYAKTIADTPTPGQLLLRAVYGFPADVIDGVSWLDIILRVPEFLRRTGLDYCDFLELQRCGYVAFDRAGAPPGFPDCLPCCPDDLLIAFPPGGEVAALTRLAVFIRLWRRLREHRGPSISFALLAEICTTLGLFDTAGDINPDFLRQLAALLILSDELHAPLGPTLLALWKPPGGATWDAAVALLLARIEDYAEAQHAARRRGPELLRLAAANLGPLSRLCGFDPVTPSDTWHAHPAASLRFVEVLTKIYASDFTVGEVLFLFTVEDHLDGDDPFPLSDVNEALDHPLGLPEEAGPHSLWALRRRLLETHPDEADVERWNWPRIANALHTEFGLAPPSGPSDPILSLGQHFFPEALQQHGGTVTPAQRQWRVKLLAADTSPMMWNTPPDRPFHYDLTTEELWCQLPVRDQEVVDQLAELRQLNPVEQAAVQSLYFAPRATLAPFAAVFDNFASAADHLINQGQEAERFHLFRRAFAQFHQRCRLIAAHLAASVGHQTHPTDHDGDHERREQLQDLAWLVLRALHADGNFALAPWENDPGTPPPLTYEPAPSGGAFAALLGLTGAGVLGVFTPHGSAATVWREVRGPLAAFGHPRDEHNAPVPTVIPALGLTLTPAQKHFVAIRNGFAIRDARGEPLGGAERFSVTWEGVLLVERGGEYRFLGGAPTPEGEDPDFQAADAYRWRLWLRRGQRSWVLLNHRWHGEGAPGARSAPLALRPGAYNIELEFAQDQPDFADPAMIRRRRAGFEVKYAGPDSGGEPIAIPLHRLFRPFSDASLGQGFRRPDGGPPSLAAFLDALYTSSLRDIRRTYQRAFKALLLAHRFGLSAHREVSGQSELGYILGDAERFRGAATVRTGPASFKSHHAWFDFDFLPVADPYHPPPPATDSRAGPSPERQAAMFDWWERLFDYAAMRRQARAAIERPAWRLFAAAAENEPDDPAQLLRHLGIDITHASLVQTYFDLPADYALTAPDLTDERWPVRIWRAERWLRSLLTHFHPRAIEAASPAQWAADDPGLAVGAPPQSGNMNLTAFVQDGSFKAGEPRRFTDVRRLNDALRERARTALLAFLCGMDRTPSPWSPGAFVHSTAELSALLLQDVCAGRAQEASRIEDAISAVQSFVQRARLGLEPSFPVSGAFLSFWEGRFASFRVWERCRRRQLYHENWIEWDELPRARKVEAFRFLEDELRRSTLTVPVPAGMEWWPDAALPPSHPSLTLLQAREPAEIRMLTPGALPEGLDLRGKPERDARPDWLAPIRQRVQRQEEPPRDNAPSALAIPPSPVALPPGPLAKMPFWIRVAVRLGARFIRIAAAGGPPGSSWFAPHHEHDEHGCCAECGCVHPPRTDEYYFWLMDTRSWDPVAQNADQGVAAADPLSDWHRPDKLPALLAWPTAPATHLYWCRMHNGEFQTPRRSDEALEIDPASLPTGARPQLDFFGRTADSLRFTVSGGIIPPGFPSAPPAGFRYDMATDSAIVLPEIAAPPAPPAYIGGLTAYPFFTWFAPGAPVEPLSLFSIALAVAGRLRSHCRFDAALKWYQLDCDPLHRDNLWAECLPEPPGHVGRPPPPRDGACCPTTAANETVARHRAVLLEWLETLLQWTDALLCRGVPEAARQASVIGEVMQRVLGPAPLRIRAHDERPPMTISAFVAGEPPLNPRLVALYERVDDRMCLIHHRLDGHRLKRGDPGDLACCGEDYWSDGRSQEGWRGGVSLCCDQDEWCLHCCTSYRFVFHIQKAIELADMVRSLGSSLLTAYERGDAEYLAAMRATQDRQLQELGLQIRRNAWRDADWQVQALRKTKENAQTRLRYFNTLIANGLNAGEIGYEVLTGVSTASRLGGNISEAIAQGVGMTPDFWFGVAGIAGTPLEFQQIPAGNKLAAGFATAARIMNALAEVATSNAGLSLTEGGWARREAEWREQVAEITIEIEQIERQILGADRRRAMALRELNNAGRQLEQAQEMQDFLRDKFTSHQLYLYLQQETAALHRQAWELAMDAARIAERAFNIERGFSCDAGCAPQRFLPDAGCDSLHQQLLAGEQLEFALRRMEKAYLDTNCREYELTKHISLRLAFPLEFLKLQSTGHCELNLPEWLFDLDYPGHYMRRIRSVALTLPCVVGPYAGVHCRLTLLASAIRCDPRLLSHRGPCCEPGDRNRKHDPHKWSEHHQFGHHELGHDRCCEHGAPRGVHCPCCDGVYPPECDDPRFLRAYAATEAIATSTGQNDPGLFELSFRDDRYLPFEFSGAVSRWRVELPPENNQFDLDSLADLVMHLNYTAREGGEALRRAAHCEAQRRLPGDGLRVFDVRQDMPDVWHHLVQPTQGERLLRLRFGRDRFPFVPFGREVTVTGLELFFELADPDGCASHVVQFRTDHAERDPRDPSGHRHDVVCDDDSAWGRLYRGRLPLHGLTLDGNGRERDAGVLRFSPDCGRIERVFLVCTYEVERRA